MGYGFGFGMGLAFAGVITLLFAGGSVDDGVPMTILSVMTGLGLGITAAGLFIMKLTKYTEE